MYGNKPRAGVVGEECQTSDEGILLPIGIYMHWCWYFNIQSSYRFLASQNAFLGQIRTLLKQMLGPGLYQTGHLQALHESIG